MKKIALFVLMTCMAAGAFGQKAAKAVYFELGGPGIASFNYDTRFSKKEDGFGGRIGFGGWSFDGDGTLLVPMGLNYIIGKDNKHYFELGAGATIVKNFYKNGNPGYEDDGTFDNTFGHLNFGYRLQPAKGGFFFRAAINPIIGKGVFFPYYAGIGLGYKF